MSDNDLYSDLPEDNELAFLQLESEFRKELQSKSSEPNPSLAYMEYVNKIYAVARALETSILQEFPEIRQLNLGNAPAYHANILPIIESYIIQVKIRNGRRARGYSVALDTVTKEKVRHLIAQIRSIVDRLDVDVRKKEALYARITALGDEIDRDRTKYDAYAALAIEMSDTAGKVTRNLNPARKLLDSIGKLFSMAKDAEEASKPQLRLEAPRRRLAPPNKAEVAESDFETGSPATETC